MVQHSLLGQETEAWRSGNGSARLPDDFVTKMGFESRSLVMSLEFFLLYSSENIFH